MSAAVSSLISKAGAAWCGLMHDDIMWPVEGHYRCRTCLRQYPVNWEKRPLAEPVHRAAAAFPAPSHLSATGVRP